MNLLDREGRRRQQCSNAECDAMLSMGMYWMRLCQTLLFMLATKMVMIMPVDVMMQVMMSSSTSIVTAIIGNRQHRYQVDRKQYTSILLCGWQSVTTVQSARSTNRRRPETWSTMGCRVLVFFGKGWGWRRGGGEVGTTVSCQHESSPDS